MLAETVPVLLNSILEFPFKFFIARAITLPLVEKIPLAKKFCPKMLLPVTLPVAEINPVTYSPVVENTATFDVPPIPMATSPPELTTRTLLVPFCMLVASIPVSKLPLPKIYPPAILAVVVILLVEFRADTIFELKLNPAAFKLLPTMFPEDDKVPPVVIFPLALIWVIVVILPPALIRPPVNILAPVILPRVLTIPLVSKLPPVTLPIADNCPDGNTLPPEIFPDALI